MKLVLAGLSAVFCGLSAYGTVLEYRAFRFANQAPDQVLIDGQTSQSALALSHLGRHEQLLRCFRDRRSSLYVFWNDAARSDHQESCAAVLAWHHAAAPSSSLGAMMDAQSALAAGDAAAAAAALTRARVGAPHLAWLAQARLRLVLPYVIAAGQMPDEGARADVALSLNARGDLSGIVGIYEDFPHLQDWFIDAMSSAPPAAQRRFLSTLRASQETSASD